MHGLEYVCKFHNKKHTDLAGDLGGIATQNITAWITNRRKIPKERLDALSAQFNIDKKYLVIENLTDIEKLEIEKILLQNELNKTTKDFEGDVFYDKNLPALIKNTDDNIKKTELLETIKKQMSDNEVEATGFNMQNFKLFKKFCDLVDNNKVNKEILKNVLQAVELASINGDDSDTESDTESDTDIFRVGLAKAIRKYDEIKKRQKEEFERLSKELFDTDA